MTSKVRAHDVLFDGTVDDEDYSAVSYVGPASDVAIFIDNTGGNSITFTVLAGVSTELSSGRNDVPDAEDMFDYVERDNSATLAITVASGAKKCFDLSPFAPQFLALQAAAASGSSTVRASLIANG